MPRAYRAHAPHHGVHITARTVGGAHWFNEPLRREILSIICEGAASGHSDLLACVVMMNHFHIVIKQGVFPLGWMMQRIMQRIAHRVRKAHSHEGHVFGRRYWSSVCDGPSYLRQAIIYTHLNPWKARLCGEVLDYECSSHLAFIGSRPEWATFIAEEKALLLFADKSADAADMRLNYVAHISYWMQRHRNTIPGERFLFEPPEHAPHPSAELGDEHWFREYSHTVRASRPAIVQADIRDRAIAVLRGLDPDCDIDTLRTGGNTRALCRLRRNVAAALHAYSYKGAAISRVLRMSPSVVSDVASQLRRGL